MDIFILTITLSIILHEPQLDNLIYNFNNSKIGTNWVIINDGVMGGLSKGQITLNDNGNGVFSGIVSTDNNGGFSLLRHQFKKRNVSEYNSIAFRIKGDKKYYQFRIKSNKQEYYSYVSNFKSTGDWETIVIPFKDFEPQYRGRSIDKPNFIGDAMEEIAFLIGNKTNETFELEIESIKLLK